MTDLIVPKPGLSDKRAQRLLILKNPARNKLRERSDKMTAVVLNFNLKQERGKLCLFTETDDSGR
ncbi:MAG: hypothetical protein QOC96_503 [Acidobacteriota bacterium]|jgi:hypothetical protein|nr:hypothetical protein [Acidobacteriota bacterium]